MLDQAQIEAQIAGFGESLRGDDNLFALVDLRLPPEDQIPRIMTGSQAEGMIRNGHYHVQAAGENSSSKANLRAAQIAKVRADNPDFSVPKTVSQQLAEAQAKIAELQAASAAPAPAETPDPMPTDLAGFEAVTPWTKAVKLVRESVTDTTLLEALKGSSRDYLKTAATDKLAALQA